MRSSVAVDSGEQINHV